MAFSEASDGDVRNDRSATIRFSEGLAISPDWAWPTQVHGAVVVEADSPGQHGPADAIWTTTPGLPVAIFTADCFGVVLTAPGAVGVAHSGWRGTVSGVVARLLESMSAAGHGPTGAAISAGIGPCCFEVGAEVAEQFPPALVTSTTQGSTSVDLQTAIIDQLDGLEPVVAGACTRHDDRFFSFRRDATSKRQVVLGWIS